MKKPLLSEMTLREKIGQCLLPYQWDIYCTKNYDLGETGELELRPEEEVRAILEKEQFGTFWAEQIWVQNAKLTDLAEDWGKRVPSERQKKFMQKQIDMQKIPALSAGDAEAGCGHVFEDCSRTPRALAIGATDSEELAYEVGACIAKEYRCGGINWLWSPVVDIHGRFSISTLRSFAPDNPDRMIALANAQIRGIQDNGVAAGAKHFPGGDRFEYRDSHFCKAMNSSTMEEWWAEQGKIFQGVIDGGVYSIMIGHHAFPAADDTKINDSYIPSTLSKKIITELLKEKMGFKGVVITDGIVMAGLFSTYPYETLIVELVKAGNDVILGSLPGSGDILEKAVLDGKLSEERINDACQRVLDMKEKLGLFNDDYRNLPTYKASDITPHTAEVCREVARKSMTLVRDRKGMLPLNKEEIKNVAIICSTHHDPFFDQLQVLKKEFENRGAKVHLQRRLNGNDEIAKLAQENDLILYAAYVDGHKPMGGQALFGEECKTYIHAFTSGREKSLGVSFGYPFIHYDIMENADAFVNAYSPEENTMKAFAEAIYGEIPFKGVSPFNLTPSRRIW